MSEKIVPIKVRKPVHIDLEYPIEYDGKTISKLILHRPKGKHIKKLTDGAGVEELLLLSCKVLEIPGGDGMGVPNAVVSELDGADCMTICECLGDFLESGRKIGRL